MKKEKLDRLVIQEPQVNKVSREKKDRREKLVITEQMVVVQLSIQIS